MTIAIANRVPVTEATAVEGAIVYRGKGSVPMRIIGVTTYGSALLISVVKADTADRPGLRSTWQAAHRYTTDSVTDETR